MKRLPALVFALFCVVAVVVATGQAASADVGESINTYDVVLDVQRDGNLRVTETIVYDFGNNSKHGIYRKIPARFHYNETKDRIYPINDVNILMDGHSVTYKRSSNNGYVNFKIGKPNESTSGVHTYRIAYSVKGALNSFKDHEELYWNAVGTEWNVPIGSISTKVTGPANITHVQCFVGPKDSHAGCDNESAPGGLSAIFSDANLNAYSGMTVVVGFPRGSVHNTGPILEERHDFAAAFRITPWTIGGASVLALLGISGALLVAWRVGRDRAYADQIPGLTPLAGQDGTERRKRYLGRGPIVVEFTPPDRVRPAQVGTLIDERADTIDVTATIVDFAVRKHVHIREIPRKGRFSSQDWELVKLDDGDPNFTRYERTLFDSLFGNQTSVRLSTLKNTFAKDLQFVKSELYRDVVEQGWYRGSPETTRNKYRGYAIGIAAVAAVITFVLFISTHIAFIGVGLFVAALIFFFAATYMPARTGKGSAMLARILGFRQYLATAEANQIRFEEREEIFSRYLPYAIVFGVAERWADQFKDLGSVQPDGSSGLYWYSGLQGWSLLYFGASIGSFSTSTSGVMASTPPSASGSSGFGGGGFSGGGGGGGGGGSW